MLKNKIKLIGLVLVILLGGFMFVYGGYDDSPGAQGWGLLIGVIGAFAIFKLRKKEKLQTTNDV
jgi:hypothetical protein